MKLVLIGIIASFCAISAHAKVCKDVNFADQVQIDGSTLALNGLGLRQATMLKVNVYVAALYVTKTSADGGAILKAVPPYEFIMQFVRDVGADDLRKGWDEGFEKNSKAQLPQLKDRIATFNGWMADMRSGQRIVLVSKPGSVQVSVNGVNKGTLDGDDFARALLAIWLGPEPPNPEIKAGPLGGACG